MEKEFTKQEIEMLMEGLDALPYKDSTSELMISLLDGIAAKSEEDRKIVEAKRNQERRNKEAEKKQLFDRIVLLKAKLIKW